MDIEPMNPLVVIETDLGDITVEVYLDAAPLSAGNFLAYVDHGRLDGSSIYRIATLANEAPGKLCSIEVVQWGWRLGADSPGYFPPVPHEPTSVTGLRHGHGALSLARRDPGSAAGAFFFCVGDQPELNEYGARKADGQGFAAFGQITKGFDVLAAIVARAEATEYLQAEIGIRKAWRAESGASRQ